MFSHEKRKTYRSNVEISYNMCIIIACLMAVWVRMICMDGEWMSATFVIHRKEIDGRFSCYIVFCRLLLLQLLFSWKLTENGMVVDGFVTE